MHFNMVRKKWSLVGTEFDWDQKMKSSYFFVLLILFQTLLVLYYWQRHPTVYKTAVALITVTKLVIGVNDTKTKLVACFLWMIRLFLADVTDTRARNNRPCFRENQPKRSFSIKWKRAFWACFRENWVYKFGAPVTKTNCSPTMITDQFVWYQSYCSKHTWISISQYFWELFTLRLSLVALIHFDWKKIMVSMSPATTSSPVSKTSMIDD